MSSEGPIGLGRFGIGEINNDSLFSGMSPALVRGWNVAIECASEPLERMPRGTHAWLVESLRSIASQPSTDERRALAAEVEACLRLARLGAVERVLENKQSPSVDFCLGDLRLEVYCPQKHQGERRVVAADLARQHREMTGAVRVAVAIGHPLTGSGREVDASGQIVRNHDSQALVYPANKLIDRLLHKKWDARQFPDGKENVLWLDLKHGLDMRTLDCAPFRSEVAKGSCFVGALGVWHAFFGEVGSPLFADRASLEWSMSLGSYPQQRRGWFREAHRVSAAILSVLDGVVLLENPWANIPLSHQTRRNLFRLRELRPEHCWTDCAGTLERDIDSMLTRLLWLSRTGDGERPL